MNELTKVLEEQLVAQCKRDIESLCEELNFLKLPTFQSLRGKAKKAWEIAISKKLLGDKYREVSNSLLEESPYIGIEQYFHELSQANVGKKDLWECMDKKFNAYAPCVILKAIKGLEEELQG